MVVQAGGGTTPLRSRDRAMFSDIVQNPFYFQPTYDQAFRGEVPDNTMPEMSSFQRALQGPYSGNQATSAISSGSRTTGGGGSRPVFDISNVGPGNQIPPPRPSFQAPEARSFQDIVGPMAGGQGGGGGASVSASDLMGGGMGFLADAQRRATAAIAALEGQYNARKQELRDEYKLSETAEERAGIQHILAVIETQRDAGTKVIQRVYDEAITGAGEHAGRVREQGAEAGERAAQTYADAGDSAVEGLSELNREFGGAMGVSGEAPSEVTQGLVADIEREGADQAAFTDRMFGITADDIDVLGQGMRPEKGAQVGALQRLAASTSAAAQIQHQAQVNARIAQERANYQQSLQQLGGMFDQRRFGLQDQMMGIDMERARLAQQASSSAASINAQNQRSSSQSLTPEQEWLLRQEEIRMQQERENQQKAYNTSLLVELGYSPQQAAALVGFDAAGPVLNNRFNQQFQMEQLGQLVQ